MKVLEIIMAAILLGVMSVMLYGCYLLIIDDKRRRR